MASRKLEDLNVEEVVGWLASIALDKVTPFFFISLI